MTTPPPLKYPVRIINGAVYGISEVLDRDGRTTWPLDSGLPWFVEWSDGSTARYTDDAYKQMWSDLMGWANLREIVKEIVREELHIVADLIGGLKP